MTWDNITLAQLEKETDEFRTNRHGKRLLGETGVHNFLQSKGVLGKRSKPGFWEIVEGRLADYDSYLEGIELLDKHISRQAKLDEIID